MMGTDLTEPSQALPPGMAAVSLARALADELSAIVDAYTVACLADSLARLSGCPEEIAGRRADRCRVAAGLVAVWDAAEAVAAMTGLDVLGPAVRGSAAGLIARARVDAHRDAGPSLPSPTTLAARVLAAAAVETGGVFPSAEGPR